jgi:ADP-heptose:LPS heptosyltransferase
MPNTAAGQEPVHRDRLGRRLELWWRRRVVSGLAGYLRLRDRIARLADRRPASRTPGTPQRVLFLRPDRIGDMIVSTGVLRAIGSAPSVELDVLASPDNAPVLVREPNVRAVLVLDRRRWRAVWSLIRTMRARRYDTVVDCMPTAPSVTTLLLMIASGAQRRVGTRGRGIDDILSPATQSLPIDAHIVEHLAMLITPFRDDAVDYAPTLVLGYDELVEGEARWQGIGAGEDELRLLVNISAGKTARHWAIESYVEVIAHARTVVPTLRVAIMSAPHERDRGESLAALSGGAYLATGTLREAFAVLAGADTLFTPDTSIAHAAAALCVPTVDMLLPGVRSQWGLYRAPGINLESPDDALTSLSAQQAADALGQLLRERPSCAASECPTDHSSDHLTPSCLRRNATVRGQPSLVAARLAASSASSRLAGRGSFCARRNPCTAPS